MKYKVTPELLYSLLDACDHGPMVTNLIIGLHQFGHCYEKLYYYDGLTVNLKELWEILNKISLDVDMLIYQNQNYDIVDGHIDINFTPNLNQLMYRIGGEGSRYDDKDLMIYIYNFLTK